MAVPLTLLLTIIVSAIMVLKLDIECTTSCYFRLCASCRPWGHLPFFASIPAQKHGLALDFVLRIAACVTCSDIDDLRCMHTKAVQTCFSARLKENHDYLNTICSLPGSGAHTDNGCESKFLLMSSVLASASDVMKK